MLVDKLAQPEAKADLASQRGHKWQRIHLRIPRWVFDDIAVPLVATRVMLTMVAWLGFHLLSRPVTAEGAWELSSSGESIPLHSYANPDLHPFLNMWSRWDSYWYLDIAQHGYQYSPGLPSNAAFYPLYPLAMRLVHGLTGMHGKDIVWVICGLIISNLSLGAALIYLRLLTRLDFEEAVARRVTIYLLVFPTTLFFSAVYTESLFLALTLPAIYYARRNRWLVAGLLASAAAICRPTGFLIALPLLYEYLQARQFRWRNLRADILVLAGPALALFGFASYFRVRFGSWQILRDSHAAWHRDLSWHGSTLWTYFQASHPFGPNDNTHLDMVFAVAFFLLALVVLWRMRVSYGIYAVASLLFVTAFGLPVSIGRFGLVIFPLFIALALLGRNEWFHRSYLLVATGLAAFFMLVYSQWGWVA